MSCGLTQRILINRSDLIVEVDLIKALQTNGTVQYWTSSTEGVFHNNGRMLLKHSVCAVISCEFQPSRYISHLRRS